MIFPGRLTAAGTFRIGVMGDLGESDMTFILEVIDEMDVAAFQFTDEELRWRGRSLTTAQIAAARRDFAHSFGSCSFEEPLADLRALGLLP